MLILIIEDDPVKLQAIRIYLGELDPQTRIDYKMSYQSGLLALLTTKYDLIILDMQLPNYDVKSGEDGYKPRPVAGRDILREIKRKKIHASVVILTQYEGFGENGKFESLDQWDKRLSKEYANIYLQTIQYKPGSNSWKEQLSHQLNLLKK
jgi:CheY-like chemotaxis protein